ncbi:carbohydrate ABC transporter permease [Actinomyces sp.]|uniref:carbohydrate ABC transporter permease n=1 Tax=Actinomyces sp. TaxID=29317 RepID=UPI0026DC0366|nr:carbohydrate ABC transporter permease [Actinomyces sp.]MDO4899801.1 carbohydrate ABC transporter permease [Actinomyces sp.]
MNGMGRLAPSRFDSALGWTGAASSRLIRLVIAAVLLAVFGVPFLTVISSAFSHTSDPTQLAVLPTDPTLDNFRAAGEWNLFTYLRNSLVIAGGGLLLQMTASVLAGYALSRRKFRGQALVMLLFLMTMMLPEEVIAVPLSIVLGDLPLLGINLKGTVFAIILPVGIWGFSIMVMTEFMRDIPEEICEAARLDGLGEIGVLGRIVLPMCKPALGVITIFGFIMIWNQYLLPLIASNGPGSYTITVAIALLRDDPSGSTGLLAAGSVLALVPSLIVYLLLQSSLVRGITAGAGK